MLVMPTAAASVTAWRASWSSRPTRTTPSSVASASQASLEPKPARSAVMQTAPGI